MHVYLNRKKVIQPELFSLRVVLGQSEFASNRSLRKLEFQECGVE